MKLMIEIFKSKTFKKYRNRIKGSNVTFSTEPSRKILNIDSFKYIKQAIEDISMLGYIENPIEKFIVTKLVNFYYLVKK